jgi:hypothetical protein
MGLDTNFAKAEVALESKNLDLDIAKTEYRSKKKKAKGEKEKGANPDPSPKATPPPLAVVKAAYKKAVKAVEAVKLVIIMEGAKAFKLYGNLLSEKARQPWEKIIKAHMTCAPWEDVYGVMHI